MYERCARAAVRSLRYAEAPYAGRRHGRTSQPLFRLLGFPVHVGAGFVIFMVLLAFLNEGGEFGWWLAGSVAAFTLIHELAHAVVARRAGAEASISLEFMAGFTSYHADQPISRPWTLAISLAGPLTHIAAGVALLVALGGDPFERPSAFDEPELAAVWWAGPVIGADQPDPCAPARRRARDDDRARPLPARAGRDGDDLRQRRRDARRAAWRRRSSTASRGMTVFIGFLLLIQLQGLFAHRQRTRRLADRRRRRRRSRDGDRRRAEALLTQGVRASAPRSLRCRARCSAAAESPELARPDRQPSPAVPPGHPGQRVPA